MLGAGHPALSGTQQNGNLMVIPSSKKAMLNSQYCFLCQWEEFKGTRVSHTRSRRYGLLV